MSDGGVRKGRGWGRWDEGGEGGGRAEERKGKGVRTGGEEWRRG